MSISFTCSVHSCCGELRRVLKSYADYYNCVRTHRSLDKDAPVTRQIQRIGSIKSRAMLGGLVLPKLQSAAWHPSGLVCAMATHPINDYYVITSRRGERPDRWSWEMRRKSKPLGIKMTGDGFQSEMAAQFAGKRALADFLSDLSKEEKDPRK